MKNGQGRAFMCSNAVRLVVVYCIQKSWRHSDDKSCDRKQITAKNENNRKQ